MIENSSAIPPRETRHSRTDLVIHKVKSWPHLFEATLSGLKTHEMRQLTDRDYRVGDTLLLQEYDPVTDNYTGRELAVRITYITSSEFPCALSGGGLHPDYCILSISKIR
ncbi:ASCH/PUA domain-containing protein [Mesorhizobium sp. C268A]|uniref:DUF3850 domain-containing protein n=1 Tax=Mesorhizobium sp. C268A TaxID=2956826 RepID=UPI0009DF916A